MNPSYTIKIGNIKIAQHMTLVWATLFAEAMFQTLNDEPINEITIEREKEERDVADNDEE